jgi:CobQ-like glutamine amidotransferase family enzyme
MTLHIVAVYPDLLGTYGDTGNAEILAKRASWRGFDTTLTLAPSSEPLPAADLYCLGGGEDGPQVLAAERLRADATLGSAARDGAVVFAVCAGFQIVGEQFPDASNVGHEGLGLLEITTRKGAAKRAVGELVAEVAVAADGGLGLPALTGFENHGGVTTLGASVKPLGRVIHGVGNGGGDQSEGAFGGNVIGTYLHGPVLARNPALADLLLARALDVDALEPLDDSRELALRSERLAQFD